MTQHCCVACRYYHTRTDIATGQDLPSGDCHGLPPQADEDRQVADLRPACSLFEDRYAPDSAGIADFVAVAAKINPEPVITTIHDCPTEAPTIGSDGGSGWIAPEVT